MPGRQWERERGGAGESGRKEVVRVELNIPDDV